MWVAIQERNKSSITTDLPSMGTIEDHYASEEPAEKYSNFSKTVVFFDEVLNKKLSLSFINGKSLEDYNFRDFYNELFGTKGIYHNYGTIVQLASRTPKKEQWGAWSEGPNPIPEDGILLRHYGINGFRVDLENKFLTRLKSLKETDDEVINEIVSSWDHRKIQSFYRNSG